MFLNRIFLTLFLFIGFVVTNILGLTHSYHHRKGTVTRENNYLKHNTQSASLSHKHRHKILDTSCLNVPPPVIKNGVLVEIKTQKIKNGSSSYMIAEYKCQDGTSRHIFCTRNRWTGKKPLCTNNLNGSKNIPDFPVYVGKCSHEQKKMCKHYCVLLNGEPMCSCPPGFKKTKNGNCLDINECKDPKIKATCKHGCINYNGSYRCLQNHDLMLSDAPSKANSVEDEEEYEGGDDYDGEEYDDEDYDEESYDDEKENNETIDKARNDVIENSGDEENKVEKDTSDYENKLINKQNNDDYEEEYDDKKEAEKEESKENDKKTDITKEISNEMDKLESEGRKITDRNFIISDEKNKTKIVPDEKININGNEHKEAIEKNATEENKTINKQFDIIYDDEEYDYDYDYSLKHKNVTNDVNNININHKEITNTYNISEKINEQDKITNEVLDKTTISYNSIKKIENNEDNGDYDEKDYDETTTVSYINFSTSTSEENLKININSTDTIYNINETDVIKNIPIITYETSTSSTSTTTPTNNNVEPNFNKATDDSESTEEYDENYDETTDSFLSTTLKIATTTRKTPNSLENPSNNIITDRFDIIEESSNEISNNLSPLDNFGSNINSNKNLTNIEDEYEDSYDEEEEEDSEEENNKRLLVSELDKNKTIIDTVNNKDYDKKEDASKQFVDTDIFVTSTRRIDNKIDTINSTTTKNVDFDETEIDRKSSNLPITTTVSYDNEYDYDSEDYDSEKEESTVVTKEVEKCEVGYEQNEKGNCVDIDECVPETNPCSDICENTAGSYTCTCPAGFTLNSADPHTCQDIDECTMSPCSHICKNIPGSYRCECPQGLTLQNLSCVNLTCSQGQTRVNGVLQCTCAPGFVLGADRRTCEDIDECQLDQNCAQNCRNVIGSYECSCREGYRLERERFCTDIDECAGLSHGCHHLCENTPGSYKCKCQDGYELKTGTDTCVDINECDDKRDLDECNHLCINYQGGYECDCHPGFKLGSDDATCEDIDECLVDNGNCTHICENQQGSYACKCEEHYVLERDNHTCKILDPCLEDNGGCSHVCVNQDGVAFCRCPKGHVLEDKDCYLNDPCVTNNGGCSHICVNANNEVRCECPENYELVNKTSCSKINLCTINNGNCSHFCEFVEDRVNCMCPELYTLLNNTHCVEINPCLNDNGGCSHVCMFENHVQTCSCPDTHKLHNKTHCFEKNPCLEDNGGCSDTCIFSNSILKCSCPKNYYLQGKTCYRIDPCIEQNGGCSHLCSTDVDNNVHCLCPDNFFLKDSKTCAPQDPCLTNNGNCSHICNSKNSLNICSCPTGYKFMNDTHCVQFNPCLVDNGGCSDICENVFGKVKCSCPVNYELADSSNCVIVDPCHESNGGCSHFCEYLDEEVICSCPDHYNLINGTSCVKVNACLVNNGGCSHDCATDEKNNVTCSCPKGSDLTGKICVPINLCNHKNGGCSHICSSIEGHIVCRCPPGFELIKKTCFKINPCSINNGGCSHGCSNHRGEAKCSCPPGYKLFEKICMDEDPCTKNNGGCSHFCHNKEGKRDCSCPSGYLLRPNKRICKEINECRVSRAGCSHGCKNLPGSYQCTCPQGLQLDDLKNKTCVDVDECLNDNGECEMICRNFKGGFKCDCPEGYMLQRDKRSCRMAKVALCRVPVAPKNGVIRCWDDNSESGTIVPAGTKCNVWCNEGYKLTGESQRICNDSGSWTGNESQCLVATCPKLPSIQNGWYLPGVCNSGRTYIGESCSVYCRKGFTIRNDIEKFVCDPNMNWMPLVRPEMLYNACTKMLDNVYINCPEKGQIDFILPKGQRYMFLKVPKPDTNVDWSFVTSQPSWGIRLETTLPAGRTEVRFMASSPTDFNATSACRLVINVLDKEAPYMMGCPGNIERRLANGESTQIVHWKEPNFYDNVGVVNVYKTREPGSEFGSGLHHITYVASDEAGNRAFCHFSIDLRDDLDNNEQSNSIEQYTSATYTSHRTAGRYKAVLICPSGVQFMTDNPDRYNNMITSEAGCYWRHVKVTKPIEAQNFRIPKVYSESRLPPNVRNNNRRVFFKWSR